ncbi:hypothetical protein HQN90_36930 [Paenibacillus alba]|uniref:hypothetical protein n=1 Tax=Paenibacillus alba TaxID=1197127 RepID=UPI001564458B|nr:hypothetical protein [Paenibacillus alba]NQX71677.1 hypothetical protein [Paenibacillus alba]
MSAGNFGDVWKHNVLLEVVGLIKKENFHYVETHGNYDQHTVKHNGNALLGYHYLSKKYKYSLLPSTLYTQINQPPGSAAPYLYRSSWMQVYELLKTSGINSFNETIFENNPTVFSAVNPRISSIPEICNKYENGFAEVLKLSYLPDLVLIDPYYKKTPVAEMRRVISLANELDKKNIPYLIWYPLHRSQKKKKQFMTHLLNYFPNNANNPRRLELHDNGNSNNRSHIPKTGMIFSNTLSRHIQTIKTNLNYLDSSSNLSLNWTIV